MQQNQPLAIAKRHIKATEKLTRILIGPGAFKLPPDIHGLTLYMAFKNKDGHMGPRQSIFIFVSILIEAIESSGRIIYQVFSFITHICIFKFVEAMKKKKQS